MSDSEDDSNEKKLKIVVLGEMNVGKTNVIQRFCYDEYSRIYTPTIGADFFIKRLILSENKEINIRITDVSGSELNGSMFGTYLFKADMIIMVYDITKCESFDSLILWLRKIDEIVKQNKDERSIYNIVLFGNKCDLEHKRSVRLDKTNHFIRDNKLLNYFVSARTGENVNSSFIDIISKYFNLPLDNFEKEKQKPIIKAELLPTTPPVSVATSEVHNKANRLNNNKISKKKIKGNNTQQKTMQTTQSCAIQ